MTYTYAFAQNGVTRSDGAYIPNAPDNTDYAAYIEWVKEGGITAPLPLPSADQVRNEYSSAIQNVLDSLARSWGYDDVVSAATYANSANSKFKGEALALIGWRDQVWAWAEAAETAVSAGTQPAPTSIDAFLAQMPSAPARPAS